MNIAHTDVRDVIRADSVTWNPHKLMGVLLQCSTVHFKQNVSDCPVIEKDRSKE